MDTAFWLHSKGYISNPSTSVVSYPEEFDPCPLLQIQVGSNFSYLLTSVWRRCWCRVVGDFHRWSVSLSFVSASGQLHNDFGRVVIVQRVLLLVFNVGPGPSHMEPTDAQLLPVALPLLSQHQGAVLFLDSRVDFGHVGPSLRGAPSLRCESTTVLLSSKSSDSRLVVLSR